MAVDETSWRRYWEVLLLVHALPQPPQIDGRLEEWRPFHRLPSLEGLEGRRPLAYFFLGWHPSGLSFAIAVLEAAVRHQGTLTLEVFLDTQPRPEGKWSETCHHFLFRLRDRRGWAARPSAWSRSPEAEGLERRLDIPTAGLSQPEGYTAEFFLPTSTLYRFRPQVGEELRFGYRFLGEKEEVLSGSVPALPWVERLPPWWPLVRLVSE